MEQLRNHGGQALAMATARLHDRIELLVAAVERFTSVSAGFDDPFANIDHALRRLVGFGPGLTPSGDDALTGFLSVLQTIGGTEARARANTIGTRLLPLLSASPDITTFVSAQMLRSTIGGHFSQTVHQLCDAVTTPRQDQTNSIRATVVALLGNGATSGADTLVGILAACAVLHTQLSRVATV
jgi:hypothetical protein